VDYQVVIRRCTRMQLTELADKCNRKL